MMFSRTYKSVVVMALVVGTAVACGSPNEPRTPAVNRIVLGLSNLDMDYFVLRRGSQEQLTVLAYDRVGSPISGVSPRFISRAPTVVTVSDTGLVHGLNGGRTWVLASVTSRGVELRDSIEIFVPEFP